MTVTTDGIVSLGIILNSVQYNHLNNYQMNTQISYITVDKVPIIIINMNHIKILVLNQANNIIILQKEPTQNALIKLVFEIVVFLY